MKQANQIFLAFAITVLPQTGHAFTSTNGFSVEPVGNAAFEASDWEDTRAASYWCAAANYARRVQNAGWQADLYVVRGLAPSTTSNNGESVQFSTDPSALGVAPAGPGSSMGQFLIGDNMSVQRANALCLPKNDIYGS